MTAQEKPPNRRPNVETEIALLVEAGYLVVAIPECKYGELQHGRHGLVTRTAMCPGSEVLPHGYSGYHLGSFGGWVRCKCGSEFRDYGIEDEGHWRAHESMHITGGSEPSAADPPSDAR